MESFLEFCAGTRLAKAIQSWKEGPQRPTSPIATEVEQCSETFEKLYSKIECGNLLCIETTENTALWKEVRVKNRAYFFCSEPCYHEWLGSPQYQGFSPSVPAKPRKEPPPLEL